MCFDFAVVGVPDDVSTFSFRACWAQTAEEAIAAGVTESEAEAAASCSARRAYAHFTVSRIPLWRGEWQSSRLCRPDTATVVSLSFADRFKENTSTYQLKLDRSGLPTPNAATCTHAHGSYEEDGQCWGGGSGSCTVEIISRCEMCLTELSRRQEHRD